MAPASWLWDAGLEPGPAFGRANSSSRPSSFQDSSELRYGGAAEDDENYEAEFSILALQPYQLV